MKDKAATQTEVYATCCGSPNSYKYVIYERGEYRSVFAREVRLLRSADGKALLTSSVINLLYLNLNNGYLRIRRRRGNYRGWN